MALTIATAAIGFTGATAAAVPETILGSAVPTHPAEPDAMNVELGVQFKAALAGQVTAVRFYKSTANTGTHVGRLYGPTGTRLAAVTFTGETASGWQQANFTTPVTVTAGTTYTASYVAPKGRYADDTNWKWPTVSGDLTGRSGVYRYGGGYPTQVWEASNYYVDVVFTPTVATTTSSKSSSTSTTTTAVSTSSSPTTTPVTTTRTTTASTTPVTTTTTSTPPPGVTLRQIDGGTNFFAKFTGAPPVGTFPIGAWATVTDAQSQIDQDKAVGLNSYLEMYGDSSDSLVQANGMYTFHGSTTANGYLASDEADMWARAGNDPWNGQETWNTCIPIQDLGGKCGYTVIRTLTARAAPGQLTISNYGKGVLFWLTDAEAAQFVSMVDISSTDAYWFTDPDLCSAGQGGWWYGAKDGSRDLTTDECHMASHYGDQTDRVRSLSGDTKPVWGFVELGVPGTNSTTAPNNAQINAAVWSNIIHGALGVTYFNHSFGGSCVTANILRTSCGDGIRAGVTATNAQVKRMTPVIESPWVDGLVTAPTGVDVTAKKDGADLVLLSGSRTRNGLGPQTGTVKLSCGAVASAQVIDENRSVPVTGGGFTDTWNDSNAVHLYRIPGGAKACGL